MVFKQKVNKSINLIKPETYMAEEFFQLIDNNRDHLSLFLDFTDKTTSIEDSRHFIKHSIKQEAEEKSLVYFISDKETLIGCIDLHNIDIVNKKGEVGYWLAKEYTGQHIMTDCLDALCHIAFTNYGLNKLILLVEETNIASNEVAKQAGFTLDGIEREDIYRHNHFVNMNKYSLLKFEYVKRTLYVY